ncbi:GTPase domain-containing protein [Neobacillus sp. SM06]|uniref:GTPase domain-containing protein n=1 Tax=Neobacillus sp. SM06 TaxID=3422492 RepID=UPI003D27D650
MEENSQFIQKTFYKTFMESNNQAHPIQILGEAFMSEQEKEIPDLSYIRFAQGELYFHHKDYEAAIFKWESIMNELEPWARKNTADAYYELGLLTNAEDLYKSIETDNLTLNTEVALQLFSLYIERGKLDSAVAVMKRTVAQNPDYPNVTEIARTFFEDQQDWGNAIELAVNQAMRTKSLHWFECLKNYVDKGLTKALSPEYFTSPLTVLYAVEPKEFEQLAASLWQSYQNENSYFSWLKEINQLFFHLDMKREGNWLHLSDLFQRAYLELIDGGHLLKKLQDLVPNLLTNWLRITDSRHEIAAATAVLAWSELFPGKIDGSVLNDAEILFSEKGKTVSGYEEVLELFHSIMEWAKAHEMGDNLRLKWMVEKLTDYSTHNVFIAGLSGSGKSSFMNAVLGEELLPASATTSAVMFADADEMEINEITDEGILQLASFEDFQERLGRRRNALESILEFKKPNSFLAENKLSFMDTPGLTGSKDDRYEVFQYLHVADTILYVLDVTKPLDDRELPILSYLQDLAHETPIHFLLNKMDMLENEQEAIRVFEETKKAVATYLPNAEVFAFSSNYESGRQLHELSKFFQSIKNKRNVKEQRLAQLLFFIRTTITNLFQRRIDVENQVIESIRWNEELVMKLNGALNQVNDLEQQKTKSITKWYRSIKETIQKEIAAKVPKMLKDCSTLITENSDLSQVHLKLNDEMNKRLEAYLQKEVLPGYYTSLQGWIVQAKAEFEDSQSFLNELAEGFNVLYGEERLKLACDFKVLDDWRRDTDRMTSGFHLEKVNILLRRTPSQLILKSAGKLFGAIAQNNSVIYHKYKSFVENEDYTDVIADVSRQFFQQFELFEKSLDRDISLFFRDPLIELDDAMEASRTEIEVNQEMLQKLNTNPEYYRDPLTLFEVRLRQFEWMTVAEKGITTIY